jgi:predicted  nucleic acid-binding Zn-ribbon protein
MGANEYVDGLHAEIERLRAALAAAEREIGGLRESVEELNVVVKLCGDERDAAERARDMYAVSIRTADDSIRDMCKALAAAERRAEAAERRLAGVLTLVWEIDRHGEDRPDAIRRFKRLRRAVQGECYPFTAALAAALPGEGEVKGE